MLRCRMLPRSSLLGRSLRVRSRNLPGGTFVLRFGNLRFRMMAGNVVKDTPLGLDTGGGG